MSAAEAPLHCARHPNRETWVRCGKCDRPLCTDCMVMTPVGVRCRDCAQLRRLPTFEVGPVFLARGLAAGLAAALVLAFLLLKTPLFAFGFFLAPLYGFLVGTAIARATNEKRGIPLQAVAALAILAGLALWSAANLLPGGPLLGWTLQFQPARLLGSAFSPGFLFQVALALLFGLTRLR